MTKLAAIASLLCIALMAAQPGIACAGSCGGRASILDRLEIESILYDVALIHSIDPGLLSAIARAESGECTEAVSPKGAAGLMQLMPDTASQFGVEDRFNPVQNALGAARFIDHLRRDGKFTLPEILAAYNAGEAAVRRAGGIPRYRETEEYVRRVLWLYLLGYVPQSQRGPDLASTPSHRVKPDAPAKKVAHRYADGDSAILEELSELRRARGQ